MFVSFLLKKLKKPFFPVNNTYKAYFYIICLQLCSMTGSLNALTTEQATQ